MFFSKKSFDKPQKLNYSINTQEQKGIPMAGSVAFGQKIKELRMARKDTDRRFTLRGLAEQIGISPTLLCKVEAGEFSIGVDKIKALAKIFNYDQDELLALANRVDPDLNDCILNRPKAMAAFLRTASGLSQEALDRLNAYAKLEVEMAAKKSQEQTEDADGTEK